MRAAQRERAAYAAELRQIIRDHGEDDVQSVVDVAERVEHEAARIGELLAG
jgi:hypothetical protein